MDPITIAGSVLTLLVPFAKKAMEEFSGEMGKKVFEKAASLFAKIKSSFKPDSFEERALNRFEKEPETNEAVVKEIMTDRLQQDPAFRAEIAKLLNEIKEMGSDVNVVQRMKKGENIIGVEAGEISKTQVNVQQDIDEGKNVTGVKVNKIG